jgi:type I restriction enzyme S subunit
MEISRGYKETEVGVIPVEWNAVPLDVVAKRGSGHTPTKVRRDYWNGTINWISLADSPCLDRLYIEETSAKITPAGVANSSAVLHPAGTVVLSRDAGVGKSAIMRTEMAVSQHFMAWQCGPHLDNHFLYYWLQAEKAEFERIAIGNTIKTIGLAYFRSLCIPHPPLREQRAIAEALSDVDALLGALDRLIAKKRDIKQAAMQQLLTGQTRLPGFSGEWEVKRLGDLIYLIRSGIYGDEKPHSSLIPCAVATTAHIEIDDTWNNKPMPVRHFTVERIKDYATTEGDLIVVKSSGSAASIQSGKLGFIDSERAGKFVFSNFLMLLRPTAVLPRFLYFYLCSHNVKKLLPNLVEASTYPNIRLDDYLAIEIPVPTYLEQTAIAAVLSDMDVELEALEQRRVKTAALKQGMMQELLTGRARLI